MQKIKIEKIKIELKVINLMRTKKLVSGGY